jgi:amino acid permease
MVARHASLNATEQTPLVAGAAWAVEPGHLHKQTIGDGKSFLDTPLLAGELLPAPPQLSSLRTGIFNITVSAVGAGVLVIPFSLQCAGLVGGVTLLSVCGWASMMSMDCLERSSRLCSPQVYSYEGVARHWGGPRLERLVQLNLLLMLLLGGLMTCVELAANLIIPLLVSACGEGQTCWWSSRNFVITANFLLIAPLCVAENLHALRHSSTLALLCISFLVLVVVSQAAEQIAAYGVAPDIEYVTFSRQFAYAFSIHAMAFCAQFNLLPTYQELQRPTVARMNRVKWGSMGLAWLLYVVFGVVGYLAFGGSVMGNILGNFRAGDLSASVGRALLALSLLLKCPLMMVPLRTTLRALLGGPTTRRVRGKAALLAETGLLLVLGWAPSVLISNLAVMYAIVGATCGCMVCFILPSWIFLLTSPADWWLRLKTWFVLLFGLVSMAGAVFATCSPLPAT